MTFSNIEREKKSFELVFVCKFAGNAVSLNIGEDCTEKHTANSVQKHTLNVDRRSYKIFIGLCKLRIYRVCIGLLCILHGIIFFISFCLFIYSRFTIFDKNVQ